LGETWGKGTTSTGEGGKVVSGPGNDLRSANSTKKQEKKSRRLSAEESWGKKKKTGVHGDIK